MPQFQQPYEFQQGPPPPHFQQQTPPRFSNASGPHGFPGQPGAVPGYHPGYGGPPPNFGYGPPGPGFPNGPPGYAQAKPAPIAPPAQQRPQQQNKSDGLPQLRSDMTQRPAEMSATPTPVSMSQKGPPPPLNSKPVDSSARSAATQAAAVAAPTPQDSKSTVKKAPNNRIAVPLPPSAPKTAQKPSAPAKPQSYADATQAATAAVAAAMAQLSTGPQQAASISTQDNLTQKVNQMRAQDTMSQARGRGRGRGSGAPRGGRRDQRGADVPKEDFDFESSNAKFNKQDLVKEAIASGSPAASPATDTENINGLENGHANDADVDDVVIPPKPTAEKGYDKKTSFFDNLSSDLRDRAAVRDVDGRALRSQERSKNVETFGQGSVDSGRGGYRGRGRGRGYGRGRGSAGTNYAARGAYNAGTDSSNAQPRRDANVNV